MGTNRPCDSRLTVLKMIDITPIRWLMTNFKVTVGAEWAVPARSPVPLPIHPTSTPPQNSTLKSLCSLSADCQWGESNFMDMNLGKLGQTLNDSEGQGCLACCSPWGHKELDTARKVNNHHHPPLLWLLASKQSKLPFPPTLSLEYWLPNGE